MLQVRDTMKRYFAKIKSIRPFQFLLKDRKHIILSLSCLIALIAGLVILLSSFFGPQVLHEPGFCLVGDNIITLMNDQKAASTVQNIQTQSFLEGSKLYKQGKGYTVSSPDGGNWQMADGFPVFTNQGAYLYLYDDRFSLFTADFKTKQAASRSYIGGGKAYNASRQPLDSEGILLVKLPNGLYVNTQAMTVKTTTQSVSVPVNSVLCFNKKYFAFFQPGAEKRQITRMDITSGVAVVGFEGTSLSYDDLLAKTAADNKSTAQMYPILDNLYQYYLGNKYEYTGDKIFYPYESGYFMSWNDKLSVLGSEPLYYDSDNKLIVPTDYVLVQPQFSSMHKLPAMSQVFSDKLAAYTKSGDTVNTYMQFFLFNGTDTYIFPTGAVLNIGTESITLAPYSSVIVNRDGTLGIYPYKQEYTEKTVAKNQKVTAKMEGSTSVLSLSDNLLTFSSGQQMILFQKPSLLQEDSQKKK